MLKRVVWCLCGFSVGEIVILGVRRFAGLPAFPDVAIVAGVLAVAWGEKTGRLEKREKLTKPTTIFDGKVPRT